MTAATFAMVLLALGGFAPPALSAGAVPADIARSLAWAAASGDSKRFEAALRDAIAAAPERTDAILRHVVAVYPGQAAELLANGLLASGPSGAPPANATAEAPPPAGTGAPPAPEAPPPDQSPIADETGSGWSGSVAAGATARTGNTENVGVSGAIDLTYRKSRWEHIGKASGDYLRTREETQEQVIDLEYQVRYSLGDRSFLYGLTRYEDDRFSGFDYEFTASAGLGRDVIKTPAFEWTLAAGPTLRIARRADEDHSERAPGGRLTSALGWQVSETATVTDETELLADRDRVRAQNEVGLKLRIIDRLSAKLSFKAEYRSDVPEHAKHADTTTRGSLVYDF